MNSAAPKPSGTATTSAISPTRIVPHSSEAMPKVPVSGSHWLSVKKRQPWLLERRPGADEQEDADQAHDRQGRDRRRPQRRPTKARRTPTGCDFEDAASQRIDDGCTAAESSSTAVIRTVR